MAQVGLRVKTDIKAGRLRPGECECTNGEKWCMDARGGIRNAGPCGDSVSAGGGTGIGGGIVIPDRP